MERKKKICTECKNENYIFSKGRCKSCAQKGYAKKSQSKKAAVSEKVNLSKWYLQQKTQIPDFCEECGCSLEILKKSTFWTTIIAHIVPKRANKYPTVAAHPLNRVFLCDQCHNRFDNLGISEIKKFRSLQIVKRRFKVVYKSMSIEEQHKAEIEYEFLF